MSIPENVKHSTKFQANLDLANALQTSHNTTDTLMEELYDYNVYGSDQSLIDNNKYYGASGDKSNILNNIRTMIISDLSMQQNIIASLNTSSEQIKKTYNKSGDMYRNQKYMNSVVKSEHDALEKRNYDLLQGMDNKKRSIEINNYHYKRNNAQVHILYMIVYLCILSYVLYYLNENVKFIMPDLLYALLTGLTLGLFVLYIAYCLYDVYLRSDHNFDEYEMHWNKRALLDKDNEEIKKNNDFDLSVCNANANDNGEGLDLELIHSS